jgi:lipopolysaccharide biosynthesis glycosyltransferase
VETLKNCDLGGSVLAAVPDLGSPPTKRLGLRPDALYFNSGVLLIDLDRWRETDTGPRSLDFARYYPDRVTFPDQCSLNWVLRDQWTPLPERWNLQTGAVTTSRLGFMDFARDAKRQAEAAQIIHFNGPSKPWHFMNNHPLKPEYLAYLSRTAWKNYKYPDYSMRNFIRKNTYRFAPFLLRIYHVVRLWMTGDVRLRHSALFLKAVLRKS